MAGIYKRGRTWWARAQRGGVEHRQSLKTADRRVADRRYAEWIGRHDALAWGDRPRRTFTEAVEKFIAEHCSTLKPASARRYGTSLKALSEVFEPLHLDEITRDKLSEFETLRRSQKAKRRKVHTAAPTIRRDLACLSSLLTSCEEWDWIPEGSNPVPGYLRRRAKRGLKEAPARTRYLTETEETALLSAAAPAVRKAIVVAIDTGLRMEEQFSLTWPQVDVRRGTISTTRRTKSGGARHVPLPERAATALTQISAQKWAGKLRTLFVFRHDTGERLLNMKKGLAGATARAKLKDVHWHDLRRTAGCRWLQRDNRSMEEVSILLGHSSVKVTERSYAFLEGEQVAQSVAQSAAHGAADHPAKASETK